MLEPNAAVWEFIARGAIVYFSLMVLVRLSGKRTVGEFTPFDMVLMLLLAESTQGALTGGDQSVFGALIVCATLLALNYIVGFLSTRSKAVDRLVEGEPVVLIRNGQTFHQALKRQNIPESDLAESLRRSGVGDAKDVSLAMLETNGEISVVSKVRRRKR